jgi:hypothetical protein
LCLVLTDGRQALRTHGGEISGSSVGHIMAEKFICDLLDRGFSYFSGSLPDFRRNLLLNLDTSSEGEDSRISEIIVTCFCTMKCYNSEGHKMNS